VLCDSHRLVAQVTHYPHVSADNAKICEAACAADAKCDAWTFVVRGAPAGSGDCCLKHGIPCPKPGSATCTSGAKKATSVDCSHKPPPASTTTVCSVDYVPGAANVSVSCGGLKVHLLARVTLSLATSISSRK
jgi:hypothetical protein